MSAATINPHEAAHFGALAADWWDPHGSSAMLHKLNPVRLAYIREQVDVHWHVDARTRYALAGRSAIDVGCGWIAYRLNSRPIRYPALLLVAQRFVYRQLMYWVVLRAISSALGGWFVGWGKLERTGRVGGGEAAAAE